MKIIELIRKIIALFLYVPNIERNIKLSEGKKMNKFLELTSEQKEKLIKLAESMVGTPYKFGAEVDLTKEPKDMIAIDCSELSEYLFFQVGLRIPDGSYNQFNCTDIFSGESKIGDLLFRHKKEDKVINHVGIYLGQNRVVEANGLAQFRRVRICTIEEFSRESSISFYDSIRRLLLDKIKVI